MTLNIPGLNKSTKKKLFILTLVKGVHKPHYVVIA